MILSPSSDLMGVWGQGKKKNRKRSPLAPCLYLDVCQVGLTFVQASPHCV